MSWTRCVALCSALMITQAAACVDEPELSTAERNATVTEHDPGLLDCRIAMIAAQRAPLYQASLGRMGATSAEQKKAGKLLKTRARDTCKGVTRAKSKSFRQLNALVAKVEKRFAKKVTTLRGVSGTFLDVLIPDLADFERRCFDGDALDAEEVEAMTDAEFEKMMNSLAWGRCGNSDGAAPGDGWAAWSNDSRVAYAECVRDGIRDHLDSARETCNIAGGGQTGGSDGTGDGEPNPPQPDQDGDDDPNDGPQPPPPSDDDGDQPENPAPPASDNGTDAEVAGAVAETLLGAAGAIVGAAVAGISIAGAPESGGLSLAGLGPAVFLMRQGWSHFNRGLGRLHLLCPNLGTAAGRLGYAGRAGQDASTRGFSVADVMHQCRCEHRDQSVDTDPTGELGDDCSGDRTDRLDCIRDPYDETGRVRPECASMMVEDNQFELGRRIAECAAVSCPTNMVMGTSCGCVDLAGPGGASGGPAFDPCETVSCPPGTVPVADGPSCLCDDPTAGGVPLPGGGF